MSLHRWVGGLKKPRNTLRLYKDGPLDKCYDIWENPTYLVLQLISGQAKKPSAHYLL